MPVWHRESSQEPLRRPLAHRLDGAVGPGFRGHGSARLFHFLEGWSGAFQFGLVQDELDGRVTSGCMEFSWAGRNEMDEAFGRGRAVLEEDELHGHIFFHLGDDSAFRAVRVRRRVVGCRSR